MTTTPNMRVAASLKRLAQTRDPDAWGSLVDACGPAILRVCSRILHDRAMAEDACQEALLQVRAHAEQFNAQGEHADAAALGWVLKVTAHVALHIQRKQRRDRAREQRRGDSAPLASPSESEARAMNEEALHALRRELAGLSEAERTPIILHYYGGMNYEDVASALNCPVGTAKARVSRGVDRLRERLAVLGLIFAAGEVISALGHSAEAAEVSASACTSEQLCQWKALLDTPRQPAVPAMAAHGGLSKMIKISMGLAACVIACGLLLSAMHSNGAEPTTAPQPPQASPSADASPVAATPAELDELGKKIAESNNTFALKLYGQLAEQKGNLFFSPFSIRTALTQAMAGARGDTALEMAAALRLPVGKGLEHMRPHVPQNHLHPAYGRLLQALEGADRKRAYELTIANSLWVQEDLSLQPEFVSTLKENYSGTLELANFKNDPEGACKHINDWVEKKTASRIKEVLGPGSASPQTRLAIANAIYFKSAWDRRFRTVRDCGFTLLDGTKVTVPSVVMTDEHYPYAHCVVKGRSMSDQGYDVLEVPYKNHELSMLLFVPFGDESVANQLTTLERTIVFGELNTLLKGMKSQHVIVSMPKFKMAWNGNLSEPLEKMGIKLAFDRQAADFTGISKQEGLFINLVAHKAFVSVDEEGTEASGATVVDYWKAEDSIIPEFHADRPFVFLIRENATGSILFMGRVTDPRADKVHP